MIIAMMMVTVTSTVTDVTVTVRIGTRLVFRVRVRRPTRIPNKSQLPGRGGRHRDGAIPET